MKQPPHTARQMAPALGVLTELSRLPMTLLILAGNAYARQRERRQLAALDERMLRDIGLSPNQARKEAGKAFWDR